MDDDWFETAAVSAEKAASARTYVPGKIVPQQVAPRPRETAEAASIFKAVKDGLVSAVGTGPELVSGSTVVIDAKGRILSDRSLGRGRGVMKPPGSLVNGKVADDGEGVWINGVKYYPITARFQKPSAEHAIEAIMDEIKAVVPLTGDRERDEALVRAEIGKWLTNLNAAMSKLRDGLFPEDDE